jgi:hypothetical protein
MGDLAAEASSSKNNERDCLPMPAARAKENGKESQQNS